MKSTALMQKEIDEAVEKVLNDPMPFLKMVYRDSTRIGELQDLLGWTDKQMTMGFEVEGGKEFPEPIEKLLSTGICSYLLSLRTS